MMKIRTLLWATAALWLTASCSTIRRTATTVDIAPAVYQYPAVADLTIMDKAMGVKEWSFHPFHWGEMSLEVAKENAVAELLIRQKADVLLEPQFMFERESFGLRRLTVTGFPAVYKNFRSADEADLEAIRTCLPLMTKPELKKSDGIFSRLLGR